MKTFLLSAFALLSLSAAKAQTADEIIAKHVDAMGGKDKLSQVKSVYIESTTDVMGNQAPTKTYIVNGKGYRNESDFGGQALVQVITDTGGWMINPFAGATDATALPEEQFKSSADQVYAVDPLLNYSENGSKVELLGQEKVGEVNAYKLKYTNKYNSESTFYIDTIVTIMLGAILARGVVGASGFVDTIVASAIMVAMHRAVAWLTVKNKKFERLVKGVYIKLYNNGALIDDALEKTGMSENDQHESLRLETKKLTLTEIDAAFLETNGRISFIEKRKEQSK